MATTYHSKDSWKNVPRFLPSQTWDLLFSATSMMPVLRSSSSSSACGASLWTVALRLRRRVCCGEAHKKLSSTILTLPEKGEVSTVKTHRNYVPLGAFHGSDGVLPRWLFFSPFGRRIVTWSCWFFVGSRLLDCRHSFRHAQPSRWCLSAQKIGWRSGLTGIVSGWFNLADFLLLLQVLHVFFRVASNIWLPKRCFKEDTEQPSVFSVWLFAGNEHLISIFGSFK